MAPSRNASGLQSKNGPGAEVALPRRLSLNALGIGLVLAGCGDRAGPARDPAAWLGAWESDGYGYVFQAGEDTLRVFEATELSCLPGFVAARVPAEGDALAGYRLVDAPYTLMLVPGEMPERMRVRIDGTASDIVLRKIDVAPSRCREPAVDTPQSSFDVFAATWAEHYPFFELKRADWQAIVAANRPRITDSTAPAELFAVLQGMIEPFEDAHTYLSAPADSLRFGGQRLGPNRLARTEYAAARALVDRHLQSGLRAWCNGQVEFGMLRPDVGYLRIRSFSQYVADGGFVEGLAALHAALDTIFTGSDRWRGLVIDVRINGGGADPYGLAIASRLATAEYEAYAKQAWRGPGAGWTPPQPSLVRPSERPGFRGPVVELTGILSVSAAETFTQALLGRRPAVVRVGEPTQGVFSDVLSRRLPNGWRFGLPNERFVTDGRSYDGPGIAPDSLVPVFAPADLAAGRDRALETAMAILDAGGR